MQYPSERDQLPRSCVNCETPLLAHSSPIPNNHRSRSTDDEIQQERTGRSGVQMLRTVQDDEGDRGRSGSGGGEEDDDSAPVQQHGGHPRDTFSSEMRVACSPFPPRKGFRMAGNGRCRLTSETSMASWFRRAIWWLAWTPSFDFGRWIGRRRRCRGEANGRLARIYLVHRI